jgi:hypothetical protein
MLGPSGHYALFFYFNYTDFNKDHKNTRLVSVVNVCTRFFEKNTR